jgi:drug/metabolite transporter (DMT)-like permease
MVIGFVIERALGLFIVILTYIKLILTAVFWGGTFIAGRVVAQDVLPFSASFLRFAIASVFLVLITCRVEGKLPRIEQSLILPIFLLGLTGVFAYNVFFFKGLQSIDAGRAALIIALNPVMISFFSSILFKEELTPIKIIGILLSVIGAMTVISRGNPLHLFQGHLGWGEINIFGCVLSWVSFSLIGKTVLGKISPLVSICYSSLAGTAVLMIPALMEGLWSFLPAYSNTTWLGLFYLGFFGTVLGFVWYYEGIKKIGPTKAGLFINVVPLSAVVLAFFLLNEPLTLSLLIGAVLVSTGIYLTNTGFGKPSTQGNH